MELLESLWIKINIAEGHTQRENTMEFFGSYLCVFEGKKSFLHRLFKLV